MPDARPSTPTPDAAPAVRVGAVVLAAGASTRLGRPKQLVTYEGEPLVRRAARVAAEAGAEPVVVVLGAHVEAIAPALDALAGVRIVVHAGWRSGLAGSLTAGLDAIAAADPLDGVLLTVCDQPLVDTSALVALLAAFTGPGAVVAAAYAHTVGVPAVIGREHWGALRTLAGDAGAGRWLRAQGALVTRVACPLAAFDVDTPDEVQRLSLAGRGERSRG